MVPIYTLKWKFKSLGFTNLPFLLSCSPNYSLVWESLSVPIPFDFWGLLGAQWEKKRKFPIFFLCLMFSLYIYIVYNMALCFI
jgi:hypothetical protein